MLLPHLQQDKQVCRLLLKQQQIFGGDFVADLEIMRVQIVHDARIRQRHAFAQHGNQDAVQLHDRFGGAVEIAHQMLDAGLFVGAAQIAVFRQRALQIENQAVFFASRRQMQLDADLRQTAVAAAEQAGFHAGDDFVARQRIKIRVQPLRPCQPQHGVDVAQAACTVFHVRFQRKAGIFVVPLLHFQQFAVHERHRVAPHIQRIHGLLRQCVVAAKEARFQKRRIRRQIFVGRLQQLLQAACLHRRFQCAVPQRLHESGDVFLHRRIRLVCRHHRQIHIGIRVKLAAPVAADGQQAQSGIGKMRRPHGSNPSVRRLRVRLKKRQRIALRLIGFDGLPFLRLEGFERGHGRFLSGRFGECGRTQKQPALCGGITAAALCRAEILPDYLPQTHYIV